MNTNHWQLETGYLYIGEEDDVFSVVFVSDDTLGYEVVDYYTSYEAAVNAAEGLYEYSRVQEITRETEVSYRDND